MGAQAGPKSQIDHDAPTAPEAKLLGGPVQGKKELAAKANPITFVTKDDPPLLILHGDADPLVPLGQSELLRDAYQKAGLACELVVVKGGGHGGPGFATAENRDRIAAFFDRNLKKK
jgi:dipeptidyl aminopeptidase/acylaminoacyl peptidase